MPDDAAPELQNQGASAAPSPESTSSTQQPASSSVTSRASELASSLQGNETGGVETQTQAQPSFFDQLAEFGDDFKGITDPQVAQTKLLEYARAVRDQHQQLAAWQQQANPYVNYGRQFVALQRDPAYQQYLAARQAQAQQPQPQQAPPSENQPQKWWNPPKFDREQARRYVQTLQDQQTGETVTKWRDDTPADVRAAFEAHRAYMEKWSEDLTSRPHEVLPQLIAQEVGPLIEQAIAKRERDAAVRMFASDVNAQNAKWLYQLDPNGNPLVDPLNGTPQFTPAGQRVASYVKWLDAVGVTDPQARWYLATSLLQNEANSIAQQAAQTQQTTQQVADEKRRQAVQPNGRGANHIPPRSGSTSTNPKAPRQNTRLTVGQSLKDELDRQGMGSLSVQELLQR